MAWRLAASTRALATLHTLRELGVRIALDDFGTSYASLGYLRRFHSTDQNRPLLPRRAGGDPARVGLPWQQPGMTTTAEGVETCEQVKRVRAEGLTEMQGYVFSPPRPIRDIARLYLASLPRAATAA